MESEPRVLKPSFDGRGRGLKVEARSSGFRFWIWGPRLQDSGFRTQVSGLRFQVSSCEASL